MTIGKFRINSHNMIMQLDRPCVAQNDISINFLGHSCEGFFHKTQVYHTVFYLSNTLDDTIILCNMGNFDSDPNH